MSEGIERSNSHIRRRNQIIFVAVIAKPRYSALVDERAIVFCFLTCHEINV